MSMTADQVKEANELLEKEKLGFPDFRNSVNVLGSNQVWIHKALKKTGKGSPRLRELFGLK